MDADRKARLGERWICFSCAAKFYDLNKPEPLCPKCGSNQHESPLFKKPKRAKKATKKAARPPAPIEDDYERDVGNSDDDDVDESDDLSMVGDNDDEELDLDDLEMTEEEDVSGVEVDED